MIHGNFVAPCTSALCFNKKQVFNQIYVFSVLRSIFEKKDKDNSGSIEAKELGKCLRVIGFSPTKEDVEFLVKHFDTNGMSSYKTSYMIMLVTS